MSVSRRSLYQVLIVVACVAPTSLLGWNQTPSAQVPSPASGTDQGRPPTVLFICPHGAAKSVLASAYFQRAAAERGLNVRVDAAGVEPQEQVSTVVSDHLRRQGYTVSVAKPRAVTTEELRRADVVISLGCDVTRLPAAPRVLQQWDDVPGPSEDLKGAENVIRRRVIALVEELLAERRR
jgi:protein-tyrosine-phosphatase